MAVAIKIFLYIMSLLLTVGGFYLNHAEQYSLFLKIIDRNFYYTKQALDDFYKTPNKIIVKSDPAFSILCNSPEKYFDCKNTSYGIGRTGMYQFLGDVSVGSDFYLVLDPERDSEKIGPLYHVIKDKEHKKFNQKVGSWGLKIFWFGILLGVIIFIIDNKKTKNEVL